MAFASSSVREQRMRKITLKLVLLILALFCLPSELLAGGDCVQKRNNPSLPYVCALSRGSDELPSELIRRIGIIAKKFGTVKLTSGCRSKKDNSRVGGAKGSAHLTCEAADLSFSSSQKARDAFAFALMSFDGGVGYYCGNAIHIDVRSGYSSWVGTYNSKGKLKGKCASNRSVYNWANGFEKDYKSKRGSGTTYAMYMSGQGSRGRQPAFADANVQYNLDYDDYDKKLADTDVPTMNSSEDSVTGIFQTAASAVANPAFLTMFAAAIASASAQKQSSGQASFSQAQPYQQANTAGYNATGIANPGEQAGADQNNPGPPPVVVSTTPVNGTSITGVTSIVQRPE